MGAGNDMDGLGYSGAPTNSTTANIDPQPVDYSTH